MNQSEFHSQKATHSEVSTLEKIKRLINFQSGPLLNILDVGCGSGVLDTELARMNHTVTGLDVQSSLHPQDWKYLEADINGKWPVDTEQFDVVLCTDVPEHMYDPKHILTEARRVLKPTGRLIFGVPNHFDMRQRLRTLFGKGIVHWDNIVHEESAWDYAHIRFFTTPELERGFAKEGWHVDTAQFNYMGAGILPARFLPSVLKEMLLRNWPGLFSGKFVYLLSPQSLPEPPKNILILDTPIGM